MSTQGPMIAAAVDRNSEVAPGPPPFPDMVWVPGGTFRMGSDKHYPEERPVHRVTVDGFWIDRFPVTNERFEQFVTETGHRTFAEIPPNPKDTIKTCCIPRNPLGPRAEDSYDPSQPLIRIPRKVLKGGSHLCAPNYCRRYRPAARFPEPVDTSTCHVGFPCVVRSSNTAG